MVIFLIFRHIRIKVTNMDRGGWANAHGAEIFEIGPFLTILCSAQVSRTYHEMCNICTQVSFASGRNRAFFAIFALKCPVARQIAIGSALNKHRLKATTRYTVFPVDSALYIRNSLWQFFSKIVILSQFSRNLDKNTHFQTAQVMWPKYFQTYPLWTSSVAIPGPAQRPGVAFGRFCQKLDLAISAKGSSSRKKDQKVKNARFATS